MISEFIQYVLTGLLGLDSGQIGIAIAFVATALYWRKARGFAGFFGDFLGKLVASAFSIGVLMLLDVIPRIDIARALELIGALFSWLLELLPEGLI